MSSELYLYTKNYITEDCDFSVSHDDTFIERMFDRDNESQWISSGANSDATEVVIDITFKEGSVEIEREIDTVILINHNLEDPILEYWDGSAFQSLDSETDLTSGAYTKFSFNAVSTTILRIRNSQTITTNAEKAIGEIIACAELFNPSQAISDPGKIDAQMEARKSTEIILGDGQVHRSVVMHSLNRSSKWTVSIDLSFITATELDELQAIKDGGEAFLIQPLSVGAPTKIYYVNWPGNLQHRYVSSYTGAGFSVNLTLKEV